MDNRPPPNPVPGDPQSSKHKEKQPWWNDGDKVGGLAATMVLLALAILLVAVIVKVILWMF